jgi:hypothetical protein
MAVYIDKLRDWGWRLGPSCHMIADGNEELHAFAKRIGLKREWFQRKSSYPHYDLTAARRIAALRLGAAPLEDRDFHEILSRGREAIFAAIHAAPTEAEKQAIRDHFFR